MASKVPANEMPIIPMPIKVLTFFINGLVFLTSVSVGVSATGSVGAGCASATGWLGADGGGVCGWGAAGVSSFIFVFCFTDYLNKIQHWLCCGL